MEFCDACHLEKWHIEAINLVGAIKGNNLMILFPLLDGPLEGEENGVNSVVFGSMQTIVDLGL